MIRALAIKELRETAGIGLLALVCCAYPVGSATLFSHNWLFIPFAQDPFVNMLRLISGCLAAVLGLRQSVSEELFATNQFLLHRPLSRETLIGTKLLVGMGLYLGASALPALVYAWWAATPGTHPQPFEWSMTLEFWKGWLAATMIYLGAFLSGIRPARWKGTRLVPLIAVVFLVYVPVLTPWLWAWGLAAVLVVFLDGLLVITILHVATTRDY